MSRKPLPTKRRAAFAPTCGHAGGPECVEPDMSRHAGEPFQIIGRPPERLYDRTDTGPMYIVRFPDGDIRWAFLDETHE